MLVGSVCMLSGSCGMVGALKRKRWSMMLYFLSTFVSLIIWLVLEGLFGMIAFGLVAANDDTLGNTVTALEIRFHCCGWKKLPASSANCAYPAAFSQGRVCFDEFTPIWRLSLIAFCIIALLAVFSIVQMVLGCYGYRKMDTYRASYLDNEFIDNDKKND